MNFTRILTFVAAVSCSLAAYMFYAFVPVPSDIKQKDYIFWIFAKRKYCRQLVKYMLLTVYELNNPAVFCFVYCCKTQCLCLKLYYYIYVKFTILFSIGGLMSASLHLCILSHKLHAVTFSFYVSIYHCCLCVI